MRDEFDNLFLEIADEGPGGPGFKILLENGDFILLEDGTGDLLLES